MIQTQFHHWMLGKLPACNTTVSDFMVNFSNLFPFHSEVCVGGAECTSIVGMRHDVGPLTTETLQADGGMRRRLLLLRHRHRCCLRHVRRHRDVPDAVDVHRRHWALAVLQAVDRHLGDAVVVYEGAGHHEAVEYLMAVELKHAAADIEDRWQAGGQD